MAEIERKEVVLSKASQADIKAVFVFGAETFGFIAGKAGSVDHIWPVKGQLS